jgi:hypothetical protein
MTGRLFNGGTLARHDTATDDQMQYGLNQS